MKNYILLFISVVALSSATCGTDNGDEKNATDVVLTIKAVYQNQPFILNKTYTHNGVKFKATDFQFFLSDISLLSESNTPNQPKITELSTIENIDFETSNADSLNALKGFKIKYENVAVDDYTGLTFGIGVASDLNAKKPVDFGSTHPLAVSGNYWDAWNSYIFVKLEGFYDNDNNNSLNASMLLHTGSNSLYRTSIQNKIIKLQNEVTQELTLVVDVAKLLAGSGTSTAINLLTEGTSHTNPNDPASIAISTKISDNLLNNLKLNP